MMIMTAKVNLKKIALILGAIAAVIVGLILLLGGRGEAKTTSAAVSNNDARVKFLTDLGWEVTTSPAESSQVRIPENATEVFDRYNQLQKSQGYDLTQYAGKSVMRYVYKINNFPGATEPVYATLLVYKNQIIGGDVTNTAAGGKVQSFKMPAANSPTTPTTPAATGPAA
ncbi:MAG: DUF4830 domain-containing protein [Candidatus Faecousia sp.]|nr:DUF4830 domain-containing protein [Bacillota bacterium]MDY6042013.1 DUF4830 domain-containing protein [Candidatus Faecousia sp.]